MKKALIMGGNQFLGKHFCKKLIIQRYNVFVLNRGTLKNLQGTIHLKGDRNNEEKLKKLLSNLNFEIIIDVSAYEPLQVQKILNVLKDRFKKYIFISSASIYKDIKNVSAKENDKVGANLYWGDYAENKFLCEKIIESEAKNTNFNYTIFRPFYIYGPGNNLEREIYFFKRIIKNKPIFIPSKTTIIQFGYVNDLVNIVIENIKNINFVNKTFNISGKELLTFDKMIKIIPILRINFTTKDKDSL